jgi:hypothetical protein
MKGPKKMSRTQILSDDLWSEAGRFGRQRSEQQKGDLCFYLGVSII